MITTTESVIKTSKLTSSEARQIRLKVSATLASEKIPPSNITMKRKAIFTLSKAQSITIHPVDKGRCTVILNTSDYHTKITSLLSYREISEVLIRIPSSSFKGKVIDYLQNLEKDHIIDRPSYYSLHPGEAFPCIYGLPKIHKEGPPPYAKAIHVYLEKPSLKRGDGLRHHLSATYNAVLGAVPRQCDPCAHLGPFDPMVSHDTRGERQTLSADSHIAHVTLTTHMMPSQRIAPQAGCFQPLPHVCLHPLWIKYLGFLTDPQNLRTLSVKRRNVFKRVKCPGASY